MRAILAVLMLLFAAPALAQTSQPYKLLTTASTNSNSVKGSPGQMIAVMAVNTTTTVYYLKFYDTTVAPTCNTAAVKFTMPIPYGTSNAGGGFAIAFPQPVQFLNGIGICVTAGIADNDNTDAATGIAIDIAFK